MSRPRYQATLWEYDIVLLVWILALNMETVSDLASPG